MTAPQLTFGPKARLRIGRQARPVGDAGAQFRAGSIAHSGVDRASRDGSAPCIRILRRERLDMDSVDDLVRPHLDAYIEWHRRTRADVPDDRRKGLGRTGRDAVLRHDRPRDAAPSRSPPRDRPEVGRTAQRARLQLAAYRHAYMQRTGAKDVGCMGLYCTKDGKWQEKGLQRRAPSGRFRAKLAAWYAAQGGE